MKVKEVEISKVIPYENNPRKNDEAVKYVANSIKEFGFKQPIVCDADGVIIAGHTRYKAAQSLGLKTVPVVYADDLTAEQVQAYRLADNKVAEFAEWDFDLLGEELDGLLNIDMGEFGFDIDDFGISDISDGEAEEDDFKAEPPSEPKTKKGQIFKLGRHRLMCGDSTNSDMVSKLMGGERADICFTSPPYNMGVKNWSCVSVAMKGGHAYNEFSDNQTDDEYSDMLDSALKNALENCDDALFNIGILNSSKHGIISMLSRNENKFLDVIVWNKSQSFPLGMKSQRGMISHRCELVFCFNQNGTRAFSHPQWDKGTGINRIDTGNASGNEYASQHAATFPVEFPFEVIRLYTDDSVLDLFGGTGTTMIAAEQLGRKCYMMELDPSYCDIIIERWENFTGGKAELING